MICTQCGQFYEKGKFCVKCGIPLAEQTAQNAPTQSAAAMEAQVPPFTAAQPPVYGSVPNPSATSNTAYQAGADQIPALPSMEKGWKQVKQSQVVQQGTQISKQYGNYLMKALLHPYQTAKSVDKNHVTNGVVTMLLISLLLPLVYYIPGLQVGLTMPFGSSYLRPFLLILLALVLTSGAMFGVIRLAKAEGGDFMSVAAKFGTMLAPALAAIVLCILSVLLKLGGDISGFFLLITMTTLFASITGVVLTYRKEGATGFDPLYGAIIASLVFGYILVKFAKISAGFIFGGLF